MLRSKLADELGIAHATFEACLATVCDDLLIPNHPVSDNEQTN